MKVYHAEACACKPPTASSSSAQPRRETEEAAPDPIAADQTPSWASDVHPWIAAILIGAIWVAVATLFVGPALTHWQR